VATQLQLNISYQFQAKHFFLESRHSSSIIQDFHEAQMFITVLVNTKATYNKKSVLNIVICARNVSIIGEFSERHLYRTCEDFIFKNIT
jgi:hypothetical protein